MVINSDVVVVNISRIKYLSLKGKVTLSEDFEDNLDAIRQAHRNGDLEFLLSEDNGYSDELTEAHVQSLGIRALVHKPIDDAGFYRLLEANLR